MTKTSKLMQLVNCRLRVTLHDGRVMVGQLLAYDKHLNIILSETEEFRKTKSKPKSETESQELRRTLGLVILRGELVVSMVPEDAAPSAGGNKARIPASVRLGSGITAKVAGGKGVPLPPPGQPPVPANLVRQVPI